MEIPYTVTARPDTGLWNAKVGIWLFLASEVMLFGGLFSSYIFLRVGADYHWPVHVLNVPMGFINTLVLILSSVTVVMAWASVKMRKMFQYKVCMVITILCAGIFLCIKFFEYKDKISHIAVVLKDQTIIEGHFDHEDPHHWVTFDSADSIILNMKDSAPDYVLRDCTTPNPKFKTEKGEDVSLDAAGWKALQKQAKAAKESSMTLKAVTPLSFKLDNSPFPPFNHLRSYSPTALVFKDGTVVTGKLAHDKMKLGIIKVDLRNTPDPDKSQAWALLGDKWKTALEHHREESTEHFKKEHKSVSEADMLKDEDFLRHSLTMAIHSKEPEAGHHETEGVSELFASFGETFGSAHHEYPEVEIEMKDVERWSNFLPKYNTYFAIYFTLTGLHGLHVLGGALVMGWILLIDTFRFRKDPEHLANRVEVSGLFWHFVDLVWIFLFPLLYLL